MAKGESGHTGGFVQGISKQSVASLGEDIRYILQGAPGLRKKGSYFIGSIKALVIVLLMAAAYVVLSVVLKKRAKLRGDVVRTRNRKANKVAGKRLKVAKQYMEQNLRSPFYEEVHKALLGYISDKLAIQFADMQRDTIKETLQTKGVSEANISAFMQILEDCEMARYSYGGEQGEISLQYNKAVEVISALENEL